MTLAEKPQFRALMATLAAGRGKALAPTNLDGLWTLLADLPFAHVEAGTTVSAREDRFFPAADLIRRRVEDLARAEARTLAETRPLRPDGRYACDRCADTGWAAFDRDSGRPIDMDDLVGVAIDSYRVRACSCRAWNRVYAAKRAAEARPSREAAGAHRGER